MGSLGLGARNDRKIKSRRRRQHQQVNAEQRTVFSVPSQYQKISSMVAHRIYDSVMRFIRKVALVTGAASGIGKSVVECLLKEGAQVISADRDYADCEANSAGGARTVHLDVSREAEWERLLKSAPSLDLLVACAGVSEAKPIGETTLTEWQRVMAVNLDGAFLSVKYGAKAMDEKTSGAIVLVGSASGIKAAAGAAAYCASKAGLRMLAKVAALELKPRGIRVNCVSPAAVMTPMWQNMAFWSELVATYGSEQGAWNSLGGTDPATPSIQRMAFPEEIAKAILFLGSEEAAHITGEELVVDGGYTL
jgi:2-keto-3-deoxy-L-fuconate dehydrogenase